MNPPKQSPKQTPLGQGQLKPEDFYFNEQGYMVFTEAYHLKRGFCCNNGCKHCPYRGQK